MKHIFLFLSLFITFSAQAQIFRYGFAVCPSRTGNFLYNDGSVPGTVENQFNGLESQKAGYSLYFFTKYTLKTRWAFWAGVGYSKTGYRINRMKLNYAYPEPTVPEYLLYSCNHYDIIFPLLFKYNLSRRKSTFYLIGGPSPQVKLARISDLRFDYANGRKEHSTNSDNTTRFRSVNVNATFGIGYDLALSYKTHLFLQPTFDCNLLRTSKSAGLNRRLYSIGLQVGLTIG